MLRSSVGSAGHVRRRPEIRQVEGDDARVWRARAHAANQLDEIGAPLADVLIDEPANVGAAAAGANVLRDHVGVVAAREDRDVRDCRSR